MLRSLTGGVRLVLVGDELIELQSNDGIVLIQLSFGQLLLIVGLIASSFLVPKGIIHLTIVKPAAFELELVGKAPRVAVARLRRVGSNWDTKSLGSDLGWLKGSAAPGEKGNCVVVGRHTLDNGRPCYLAGLEDHVPGDEITLYPKRNQFTYVVEKVERLRYLSGISAGKGDQPRLTLIAKIPRADYIVVTATLLES